MQIDTCVVCGKALREDRFNVDAPWSAESLMGDYCSARCLSIRLQWVLAEEAENEVYREREAQSDAD